MNRIIAIEPRGYHVTVEAGCILQTVQVAAECVNRLLSMDWGARGSATVGGAVSTNGGGMNVLRYGNTREQVLGLEVVLADGRIWDGIRSLRKDTSGYDLKHAFIGAEGTLGIVTKASLRLHPLPRHRQSMFLALDSIAGLPALLEAARDTCGDDLQSFELLHGPLVQRVKAAHPEMQLPLPVGHPWYVLIAMASRSPCRRAAWEHLHHRQ